MTSDVRTVHRSCRICRPEVRLWLQEKISGGTVGRPTAPPATEWVGELVAQWTQAMLPIRSNRVHRRWCGCVLAGAHLVLDAGDTPKLAS